MVEKRLALVFLAIGSAHCGSNTDVSPADVGADVAAEGSTDTLDAGPQIEKPSGDPLSWKVDAAGPFHVGHRVVEITYTTKSGTTRVIPIDIFYPTLDIEGDNAVYKGLFRDKDVIEGATLAAPIARPKGPTGYPVHVYSHGSSGFGGTSSDMAHWFVSHGWVYVAPNHIGNTLGDAEGKKSLSIYHYRSSDISASLDAVEKLPASDPLAGKLSTKRVVLSGHSFGGFTTWLSGGAKINTKLLKTKCDAGDFLDCKPEDLAAFDKDLSDPRVVALIPMAGGEFDWVADYDSPKKPTLLMSGSLDVSGGPIFDRVTNLDLSWIEFAGGCHQLFALGSCKEFDETLGWQLTNTWAFAFARRYILGDTSDRTTKIITGAESLSAKITYKHKGILSPAGGT